MRKLGVYLGTSVISHLQQEDVPEKMRETLELWEQFKERQDIEVVISDLVVTEDEKGLADIYLQNGVLREKSLDDLTYIAIATLNDCRYIVSWNFKHFVNPKTIKAVNATNLSLNLSQVDIYSPSMMLGGF